MVNKDNLTTEQRRVLVHVSVALRDFMATLAERVEADKEMRRAFGSVFTGDDNDDVRHEEGSGR